MISVIIPTYNSKKTLLLLISALKKTTLKNYQIIVIDDASTDNTQTAIKKIKSVHYFKFKKNKGAATTRNKGALVSRGDILLFLDSDILPTFDIISYVSKFFKTKKNKSICITGFPGTLSENTSFTQKYKYYRDWTYWTLDKNQNSFYHFRPAIGAISKKYFNQAGGFNQKYPGATMEDMEFSYRLANCGQIIFKKDLKVQHQFGSFNKLTLSYFRRTTFFASLFLSQKKFTGVAMTNSEASTIFFAGLITFLIPVSILIPYAIIPLVITIIYYLYLQRRFISHIFKHEGLVFTVKSIFLSFWLYLVIITATIYYFLTSNSIKLTNRSL